MGISGLKYIQLPSQLGNLTQCNELYRIEIKLKSPDVDNPCNRRVPNMKQFLTEMKKEWILEEIKTREQEKRRLPLKSNQLCTRINTT